MISMSVPKKNIGRVKKVARRGIRTRRLNNNVRQKKKVSEALFQYTSVADSPSKVNKFLKLLH